MIQPLRFLVVVVVVVVVVDVFLPPTGQVTWIIKARRHLHLGLTFQKLWVCHFPAPVRQNHMDNGVESSSHYSEDHSSCSQEQTDIDINKISDRVQLIYCSTTSNGLHHRTARSTTMATTTTATTTETAAARKRSQKIHKIKKVSYFMFSLACSCHGGELSD